MEEEVFYSLNSDRAFKIVFGKEGNEECLKALILNVIDDKELIANDDFFLKNPIVIPDKVDDKMPEYDLKVVTSSGVHIEVEVQVKEYAETPKRIAYYTFLLYTVQVKKGDKYITIKKAIGISIQFYVEDEDYLPIEKVEFTVKSNHKRYVEEVETYIVSVPLCNDSGDDIFSQFIKLFKIEKREELRMFLEDDSLDERVRKAAIALEEINADEKVTAILEAERKAELKRNTIMCYATKEAKEKGMEEGREEGMQKGIEKGIEKTAINLLKEGFDKALVSKITGLSFDVINSLSF